MISVTPAESEVLAALWRRGPLSYADLIEEVRTAQAWGDATIKTLLGRLMRKGAIRSEKVDGRQRYRPLIERAAWLDGEVQALVDRLFGGSRLLLAEHLAQTGRGPI
jgi:predicted transcriptional regulator